MTAPVRVGVVGLGRGIMLAESSGAESGICVVAVCDTDAERLADAGRRLGVATYGTYDELLGHDLDAVVLANHFHQHAPLAVAALQSGRHVLSETAACFTAAEAVSLVRAVEASGCTYMLAENYAFLPLVQQMRRFHDAGDLGRVQYAEAEYVHPLGPDEFSALSRGVDHWRNWLPLLYYCSHALAPVLAITGQRPIAVSGFAVPYDDEDISLTLTARRADPGGVLMVQLADGALVKLLQGTLRGGAVAVRLHGSRGAVESLREDPGRLWLRRQAWDTDDGMPVDTTFDATVDADGSGHGGSDGLMVRHFADAVRTGQPPLVDVYRAVDLALTGILGFRSAVTGSPRLDLPDLRRQEIREQWQDDTWGPGPGTPAAGSPWPSVRGRITPTEQGLARARAVWEGSAGG